VSKGDTTVWRAAAVVTKEQEQRSQAFLSQKRVEWSDEDLRRCSRAGDRINGARPFPGGTRCQADARVSTSPGRVWICTPPRDATARRFQVLRNYRVFSYSGRRLFAWAPISFLRNSVSVCCFAGYV
jgi:hypothetical protein